MFSTFILAILFFIVCFCSFDQFLLFYFLKSVPSPARRSCPVITAAVFCRFNLLGRTFVICCLFRLFPQLCSIGTFKEYLPRLLPRCFSFMSFFFILSLRMQNNSLTSFFSLFIRVIEPKKILRLRLSSHNFWFVFCL